MNKITHNHALNCPPDDYDFYIIPLPLKNVLHKNRNHYISSQLEKLHPCFSDNCCFDSHLRLEKKQLKADVVVMQKYKIAEYKSQNKRLFVKERKHIQFFTGKNERYKRCLLASIVFLVVLIFVSVGIKAKKHTRAHAQTPAHNAPDTSSQIPLVLQKLYTPDFLQLIYNLNGYISNFEWTCDGYNETFSARVHGIFPEQLEQTNQSLKLSSVTFEDSIPCFTVGFSQKIILPAAELQNAGDYKNNFRKNILQNDIEIVQETVTPFGFNLTVQENQTLNIVAVLEYLQLQKISLSKITINTTKNAFQIELVVSQIKIQTFENLCDCLQNNFQLFRATQELQDQKNAQPTNASEQTNLKNLQKVGQITKTDGTVQTFYKDQNGKIIVR